MKMSDEAVLWDCLETLKHASAAYLRAAHEADSDVVRRTLNRMAVDKSEQKNAVFSAMHQGGLHPTKPAPVEDLAAAKEVYARLADVVGQGHAVARERNVEKDPQ